MDIFQPPVPPSTCPGNTDVGDETLTVAMQEMLWHSDNSRTRVIVDTFGQANINATMTADRHDRQQHQSRHRLRRAGAGIG